jgi:hypothetical protein
MDSAGQPMVDCVCGCTSGAQGVLCDNGQWLMALQKALQRSTQLLLDNCPLNSCADLGSADESPLQQLLAVHQITVQLALAAVSLGAGRQQLLPSPTFPLTK